MRSELSLQRKPVPNEDVLVEVGRDVRSEQFWGSFVDAARLATVRVPKFLFFVPLTTDGEVYAW